MKPWVPFPALHKPGAVVHACNPSTWEMMQEDQKVSDALYYTQVQGQPELQETACQGDHGFKTNQTKKEYWNI